MRGGGAVGGEFGDVTRRARTATLAQFVLLRGVDHRQARGLVPWSNIHCQGCAVSDSEYKLSLECLRLASDSMQLACELDNPALQSHFVRLGKALAGMADQPPAATDKTKH